ncbi:NAD(P)H-hydrate dehydratase [Empedobacter brevis]|uniref:NAD(P)H-hydrate dehydratase n=1 Tax=Empedobacter brevis TaxID=247 RepID=UPI0028D90D4D|nr:NAD(P)H-hydrate dehydratase [Empedobacter brevis]
MKILSAEQTKEWDRLTTENQKISSWDLMERAVKKLTENMLNDFSPIQSPIVIFCGKGNNGGDGLGVARYLNSQGFETIVYLLHSEKYSEENLKNQRLLKEADVRYFKPDDQVEIPEKAFIIDAIFGTGLSNPLDNQWALFFEQIYQANPQSIIAVDLPSGFIADYPMNKRFPCLKVQRTYTFQVPKIGLLLPDNQTYSDSLSLIDIGLDKSVLNQFKTNFYFLEKKDIQKRLKTPSCFSHKGTFGHALIVGGSLGKIGSIVLSAKAALKTGSGLVTSYTPKCGQDILQVNLIESMCLTDETNDLIKNFPLLQDYQGVAIGMGLGQTAETEINFIEWIKKQAQPLVIDADALNILAKQTNPFLIIPKESILTPHPKELQRLIGNWENDFDKIKMVKDLALQYQITFVIKGFYSVITTSDGKVYFNSTGNWGMATAGSGDTLSGIIASLKGQGYQSVDAALIGVYLHGLAGDLAIKKIHPHSLTASDISDYISEAYFNLENL